MQNNLIYEVLTPSGFQIFDGVIESKHSKYLSITIGNNTLKCSLNHIIVNENIPVIASDINVGDDINGDLVTKCELIDADIKMYDLVNVRNGHLYLTNNVISHNCDCDFVASGHTVIDGPLIQWFQQTTVQDPVEMRGVDQALWIWEHVDYTKNYIVVADVARGDGGDYSAFHVIDIESVAQVAEFRAHISTKDYGNLLVNIATEYNDALLVIENANIGWAVLQVAIDRGYKNLYYSPKDSSVADVSQQLARYIDLKDTSQMTPGFTTSSRTRPLLISKLDMYTKERVPAIRSKRLIEELFVFIWNGSKAEAQHGYNDDLVMSFSMGLWIRDTALKLKQQGLDMHRKTLDYYGKGYQGAYGSTSTRKETGWSMPTGHSGQDMDLTWLL
jgi:hypothetical protein